MIVSILESEEKGARVTDLDDAHAELVDLCRRIEWACEHDVSVATILERIRTFMIYARWHFAAEEGWMRAVHYPNAIDHQADHTRLLQDAQDFVASFGDALQREDGSAIATYFRFWVNRHMSEKDRSLRAFIQGAD